MRRSARKCRIDGESVTSAAAFADHLSIVWMTPAMDGLFAGPASERRRFLDRLVLAVDGAHNGRVNALERALRSRNRLLEQQNAGSALARRDRARDRRGRDRGRGRARRDRAPARRQCWRARRIHPRHFPWADIALDGWVENALLEQPATDVEDRYRTVLRENRARDAPPAARTDGPHLTDLDVLHGPKGIPAGNASTGEQKALLVGLILAHAALVTEMTGAAPLLLLDEIGAHLDPTRRGALYDALARLGAQVWMTGADPALFTEVASRAQVFEIAPGRVTPKP